MNLGDANLWRCAPARETMIELLGKSKSELTEFCVSLGEPAYRGEQIYRALYAERNFDIAGMTNLPGPLREQLAAQTRITLPTVRQRYVSKDGSVRYLFALPGDVRNQGNDGFTADSAASMDPDRKTTAGSRLERPASVEAVFMPIESRQTICISTQAGCAVDCQFCLTAQLGLIRNLSSGEILAQVLLPLEEHKNDVAPQFAAQGKQTNVVLMGQGEPLLNFDNVMAAMRILLDQKGVGLPPRRVTISTSGIVPGIERLAQEAVRPKLAISLNASHDEQRNALMPINKKYPLKMLLDACKKLSAAAVGAPDVRVCDAGRRQRLARRRAARCQAPRAAQSGQGESDPVEPGGAAVSRVFGRADRRVPQGSDRPRNVCLRPLFPWPRRDGCLRTAGAERSLQFSPACPQLKWL
jgi:23S rRNA (adenine2503-C2)-methyltransferase